MEFPRIFPFSRYELLVPGTALWRGKKELLLCSYPMSNVKSWVPVPERKLKMLKRTFDGKLKRVFLRKVDKSFEPFLRRVFAKNLYTTVVAGTGYRVPVPGVEATFLRRDFGFTSQKMVERSHTKQ